MLNSYIPAMLFLSIVSFSADANAMEVTNSEVESVACTFNIPSRGISVTAPTCRQARAGAMAAL